MCEETVNWGSASSLKVKGSRPISICFQDSGYTILLKDYLFIPNIGLNLISTLKLKCFTLITPSRVIMFSDNRLLTIGNIIHGLYYLPIKVENQALVTSKGQKQKVSFKEPTKQTLKKQRLSPTNSSFNI